METIIQQIIVELTRKIIEKAYSGGINDIDALASDVLWDCKSAAASIVEAICTQLNREIRTDKSHRKEQGLVLKEKNRPRELLTELGKLDLTRDYYYDKQNDRYIFLLDHAIGIRPYARVGDTLCARMVSLATEVSYARSADIACNGEVSRQTVKNNIQRVRSLEKQPEDTEKKAVKELHIYADEDHAHLQKPHKEKGKSSKIVPLVTVTEGIDTKCEGRHKTIGAMHFVDEEFDTKNLWKSTEGYLGKTYDLTKVDTIFIHGDGGRWIKNGLEDLPQVMHVMDEYHLEKRIKSISRMFPGRNVSQMIRNALSKNDRKRADEILHSLYPLAEDEKQIKRITEFGTYLMGNWEEIVRRKVLDIAGSCTEALVSHVLSDRFSRDPLGWSEKGLGKLAKLRVYIKNGGEIIADDFKTEQDQTYSDYADEIINQAMSESKDWTIFDGEPFVFDGTSGTQILIHDIGTLKNPLWN